MMRVPGWVLAAAVAAALAPGPARASAEPVRFLAFGDMPYDWPQDLARFSALIESARSSRMRVDASQSAALRAHSMLNMTTS